MPIIRPRNIPLKSPAPRAPSLGDAAIRELLSKPQTPKVFPELAGAVNLLRQVSKQRRSCCGTARKLRGAIDQAKARISSMPPKRAAKLKNFMGIKGKVKLSVRRGGSITNVVL
jgi:hypothetical protein